MAHEELARELWLEHITDPSERTLEMLVIHYEPLARFLARRAKMKAPPHQGFDELLSFAHVGLLDAIRKFDISREIKFDTYATRRITGEIIDGQRKLDPLTRRERRAVKEYELALELLTIALGRTATAGEIAEELGTDVASVRLYGVLRQSTNASLEDNGHTSEARGATREPLTSQEDDLDVDLRRQEIQQLLARALPRLEARERALVVMYYVEGRSYTQIADALGLRENRCRQIRKEILSRLVSTEQVSA